MTDIDPHDSCCVLAHTRHVHLSMLLAECKTCRWSCYLNIFSSLIILLFFGWGAKNYLFLVCRFLFSYRFGFLTLDYLGF